MKKIRLLIVFLFLSMTISCSDGTQTGELIEKLIKEKTKDSDINNDITRLIIEIDGERSEYQLDQIKIEEQFIKIGNEYINMGRIRTIKVAGKELEITL